MCEEPGEAINLQSNLGRDLGPIYSRDIRSRHEPLGMCLAGILKNGGGCKQCMLSDVDFDK